MKYNELLEKLETGNLITKNKYDTTIDLYVNDIGGNSLVITDKAAITKKTELTTVDIYALRYCALNLHYQGEKFDLTDDDNSMQNNTLRLNDFEGYFFNCIDGDGDDEELVVDSLFIGIDNNIYCYVWIGGNDYLIVKLF